MPNPIVNVNVQSDDPSPVGIAGVVVQVHNTSFVFQTSATTDSDGNISVTLPDGTYELYFYKPGVSILPGQPQQIVVDHTLSNSFQVTAHVKADPESTDPRRCTISGYILGVDGKATVTRLIFEPVRELTVLSGNIIAPDYRIEISSDDSGYFEFELLRHTNYYGYFLSPQDIFGQQPGKLCIFVPDAPAINLSNLLFPVPISLSLSATTITIAANGGINDTITVSAAFTDGNTRDVIGTAWAGVDVTISDNRIVDAAIQGDTLTLTPHTAGTATITFTREIPSSVFFDPLPDFTSDTLTITVT